MGESEYPPALASHVLTRLNQPPAPGYPSLVAVIAGMLAALIVVSLVYVRVHTAHQARPAAPAVQIPQSILDATHMTAAAALITSPNLSTTIRQEKISLVGAYADAQNTVLIFRVVPATNALGISLWDDTGFIAPAEALRVWPDGYQSFEVWRAPDSGKRSVAHITVAISNPFNPEILHASSIRPGYGDWNFSFDLEVRPATTLPVQSVISLGAERFTVEFFQLTPSVIYLRAVVEGASITSHDWVNWAVLTDPSGAIVSLFIAGAGGGTTYRPLVTATWWWPRPDHATTLTLRITGQSSGTYTTTVSIPPPETS